MKIFTISTALHCICIWSYSTLVTEWKAISITAFSKLWFLMMLCKM